MVDLEDIKTLNSGVKHYRLYCDRCGSSRGYHQKSRADLLCKRCIHKGKVYFDHSSPEFKEKMSKAKKGQIPWCKGQKLSAEFRKKVSDAKLAKSINPRAKEHRALRTRMSNLLNSKFYSRAKNKTMGTFRYLNFSVEELKSHLESKFYPHPITGELMTWDNKGRWHIDHIIPDSWFTYSTVNDEEFKLSWALSNLQPKWAEENLSKGNRYAG